MKRIIYNTKLKKILSFLLVVMIISQFMMPSVVMAATIEKSASYTEWITGEDTKKYKDKIESKTKDFLDKHYIYKGITDEKTREEQIEKVLSEKPDLVIITGTLKGASFTISSLSLSEGKDENGNKEESEIVPVTRTYSEMLNWLGIEENNAGDLNAKIISAIKDKLYTGVGTMEEGYTPEEVAKEIFELNRGTIQISVTGTKDDYKITDFNVPGKDINALNNEVREKIPLTSYSEMLNWLGIEENNAGDLNAKIISAIKDKLYPGVETKEEGYTPEQIAKKIFQLNKGTIQISVIGTKDDYKITDVNIPGKDADALINEAINNEEDEEDSADLGGILLSPVFYLINFIADAITSNLGRIMNGDSLSAISGTKVLIDIDNYDPTEYNTENTATYEVNLNSFMPNILSDESYQYPNIKYTPEEIFAGKIDLLSIDFISGTNYEGEENSNEGWLNIRKVISQWYQVLRMIAIIGLLSVLIYTGIKIIISSNAKDKAKYKEWIINWFMAVAILFSMHIIMAFIISVTGEFSKLISESCQGIKVQLSDGNSFVTNLMGLVRFMIQSENFYMKVAYEVMYIALIVYTIKFTLVYLKRVLNMAFLTLIAPIVALTYPIDKLNDGRAQGFDMWLKEYMFNALLQPMHQIMYYILVGSAVSIAASNPIYGIVVLMFMTEAERLLKKIFGFDKASGGTVGGMAGAFAAGAIASNIKNIAKLAGGSGGNSGKGADGASNNTLDNPKPTSKPGMDVFGSDGLPDSDVDTGGNSSEGNNNQGTSQQRMLDAYNEDNFGTDEYDSSERESMAREAYNSEGIALNEEQQRDFLREQGWSEEDINDKYGTSQSGIQTLSTSSTNSTSNLPTTKSEQSQVPIREMAKRVKKGAGAVGKRLLKPAWDLDKSAGYNFKRLAKGAGRAAIGLSLGTAAAAVQAGISITDGKYNPAEGLASFAAGYAGGGQIAKGLGSLVDTYREGTIPDDAKERKEEIMRRAKERFGDRDDVIAFNKKNYPGEEKSAMERQRDNYLTAGITDLKEMKSGMKYADKLVGKTDGLSAEQIQAKRTEADKRAAATIDFRKTLQDQGQLKAVYDKEKREKYIQSMVDKAADSDKAKVRRQYENAFKSVAAYDAANS